MVKEIVHILKTYLISFQYFKKRWYKYIYGLFLTLLVIFLAFFINLTL